MIHNIEITQTGKDTALLLRFSHLSNTKIVCVRKEIRERLEHMIKLNNYKIKIQKYSPLLYKLPEHHSNKK